MTSKTIPITNDISTNKDEIESGIINENDAAIDIKQSATFVPTLISPEISFNLLQMFEAESVHTPPV